MPALFLFLVIASSWQAQPPAADPSLDDLCRTVRCREARSATIETPDGRTATVNVPRSPIVSGGVVSVFIGERVVLVLEPLAGGAFRVSAPMKDPGKGERIELELRQENLKPGEPKVTLLVSSNSLTKIVHFTADMVLGPGQAPRPTSICPLHPSVLGYEMWPHPVPVLLLRDFVVVPADTPCK